MTRYALRYKPGSPLGLRFTGTPAGHFATRQHAEDVRDMCTNADQIEVVEVEER